MFHVCFVSSLLACDFPLSLVPPFLYLFIYISIHLHTHIGITVGFSSESTVQTFMQNVFHFFPKYIWFIAIVFENELDMYNNVRLFAERMLIIIISDS